jgi:hypothetical protein
LRKGRGFIYENKMNYMMRKLIFFFSFLFLNILSLAQTPEWLWAKRAGGSWGESGNDIVIDKNCKSSAKCLPVND